MAMNSLFINVARCLWAFDVLPAIDGKGKEVVVDDLAYSQGFNSGPLPFKARFVARSKERRRVVEKAWEEAEKEIGVVLDEIGRSTSRIT